MKKRLFLAAAIIMITGLSHVSVYAKSCIQLDGDKLRKEIGDMINEERIKYGVAVLDINDALEENAQLRAKEMVESLGHIRPDGKKFSSAITLDYQSAGENIAYIYAPNRITEEKLSEMIVNRWLNSEGHRNNILKSSWGVTGMGVYIQDERIYIVQLFVQEKIQ